MNDLPSLLIYSISFRKERKKLCLEFIEEKGGLIEDVQRSSEKELTAPQCPSAPESRHRGPRLKLQTSPPSTSGHIPTGTQSSTSKKTFRFLLRFSLIFVGVSNRPYHPHPDRFEKFPEITCFMTQLLGRTRRPRMALV